MKTIFTLTIAVMTALSFVVLTSCDNSNSSGKDLKKSLQKEGTALEKVPGKAINKAQNAYDDANKQLENALK